MESPTNSALSEALRSRRPRFFRADHGIAKGKTGPEDTGHFVEYLMILQECAILLSERLEMGSISHAVLYDGEETAGFCFDLKANVQDPNLSGAIVNRRAPVKEFIQSIKEFASA